MSEFWEYSYDLADQLESIAIAVGAEYECDAVNRLRQVKVEGDVIMRHIYDAEGIRRLSKDDNGDRSRFSSSGGMSLADQPPGAELRAHSFIGGLGQRNEGGGLVYARQRWYDPQLGRWLSRDPIGFQGGLNLYTYVENNPTGAVDPDGLESLTGQIVTGTRSIVNGISRFGGDVINFASKSPVKPAPRIPAPIPASLIIWGMQNTNPHAGADPQGSDRFDSRRDRQQSSECPEKPGRDYTLYRRGRSWESRGRLERKSWEAKAAGFPHGVSTSMYPTPDSSSATLSQLRNAGLDAVPTPTRNDPTHHTVLLNEPVTSEQARIFNLTFGRTNR